MMLESTVTCPACGYVTTETMPTDACRFFYDCKACNTRLKPKAGDCCVYCSYGSVPCPPVQADGKCCGPSRLSWRSLSRDTQTRRLQDRAAQTIGEPFPDRQMP